MKPGKLCKHVILSLGERGSQSAANLRIKIKKQYYFAEPIKDFNAVFKTALAQLIADKVVKSEDGQIVLASKGLSSYKSYVGKNIREQNKQVKHTNQDFPFTIKSDHERGRFYLQELAGLIGKVFKNEYKLARQVRLDHVWFLHSRTNEISHAFEIQNKGDWKNAIGDLEAAKRYHENCRLFIAVADQEEVPVIRSLLNDQKNNYIKILNLSQLHAWVEVLREMELSIRRQTLNTVADMLRSNIID